MGVFSQQQEVALHIVSRTTSSLSCVGAIWVLYSVFIATPTYKRRFTQLLVGVLSSLDLFTAIFFIMGDAFVGTEGESPSGICVFQGFAVQFGALAGALWTSCLAFNLHQWVNKRKSEETLRSYFKFYLIIAMCASLFVAVLTTSIGSMGNANIWCWITDKYERIYAFYMWIICIWIFNIIIFIAVVRGVKRRFTHGEDKMSQRIIVRKLLEFLFVYIFIWTAGLINRIANICDTSPVFWGAMLHVLVVPSSGILNATVYGGAMDAARKKARQMLCPRAEEKSQKTLSTSKHIEHRFVRQKSVRFRQRMTTIFMGTWNLAEQLPSVKDIKQWLPPDLELYIIGVQECMQPFDFKDTIHQALNEEQESSYVCYDNMIGSDTKTLGYHGYILLTIWVKHSLVADGTFELRVHDEINRGVPLPLVGRAANKGSAAMACRFFNTSFAFLTCHLTSDTKGASKVNKRNQDVEEIIRGLRLAYDDIGFDFHDMHHHVFFLGDLNYRLELKPEDALRRIADVYSAEGEDDRNELWQELFSHDELALAIDKGHAFFDFQEHPIRFPPTFRRKRGSEGYCSDLADFKSLEQAYTTFVTNADGTTSNRTPSYTDRIIWHSLPDVASDVKCLQYGQTEELRVSDHNPVHALFEVDVTYADNTSEVGAYVVSLDKISAVLHSQSTIQSVEVVWPIPSEDYHSNLRKLQLVAARFMASSPQASRDQNLPTHTLIPWCHVEENRQITVEGSVNVDNGMHMLVRFLDSQNHMLGQSLLCLQEVTVIQEAQQFYLPITNGGQAVGQFKGNMSVRRPDDIQQNDLQSQSTLLDIDQSVNDNTKNSLDSKS